MSEIKIWHNPHCSKSRQGLAYLQENGCELSLFEYTKEEIDPNELAALIRDSDEPLAAFIRTNEKEYAALGLAKKELTPESFAEIAAKHPKLLQRPIVIKDGRAIVARPAEKIKDLL